MPLLIPSLYAALTHRWFALLRPSDLTHKNASAVAPKICVDFVSCELQYCYVCMARRLGRISCPPALIGCSINQILGHGLESKCRVSAPSQFNCAGNFNVFCPFNTTALREHTGCHAGRCIRITMWKGYKLCVLRSKVLIFDWAIACFLALLRGFFSGKVVAPALFLHARCVNVVTKFILDWHSLRQRSSCVVCVVGHYSAHRAIIHGTNIARALPALWPTGP